MSTTTSTSTRRRSAGRVVGSTPTMLPGDVGYLRNDGDVDLASVVLGSSAAVSSRLDTDAVHGLQLAVDTCEVAWVRSGDSWTCAPGADQLYAGPVTTTTELTGAYSLAAGKTDHLMSTISFPTRAATRCRIRAARWSSSSPQRSATAAPADLRDSY